MFIKSCSGYELEKEKSNTSEDFFNRSEVTFTENGEEKTLNVLYIRYFDEKMSEFTPFEQEPVFQTDSQTINFKDIVAICCLIKNPGLRHRKRIYINSQNEFASYFQDIDFEKLKSVFESLGKTGGCELRSPLEYIVQRQ